MKTLMTIAVAATLYSTTSFAGQQDDSLALEPCLNSEVSANGLYSSQAVEDYAFRLANEEPQMIGSGADDPISALGGYRDAFER